MNGLRRSLTCVLWGTVWRRRVSSILLVVAVQAVVLGITYQAVVVGGKTLLTGTAVNAGSEGSAPPYGYPGPALRGWNEVDAGASAWAFVPMVAKAHMELSQGELPLWDANVMLGVPLVADATGGLLNPLEWPLLASPTVGMWNAWLLLRLLMAGLLCTLLAWYLGLRLLPSTVAGLIFMMSGVFQLRTTTIQTSVMALLPLVILGAELCIRRPSRWSAGLLGLAIGLSILPGMPEETFICLSFAAIYFVVRYAARWLSALPLQRFFSAAAAVGGAVAGILLSLPLLVPLAQFIGDSTNFHTVSSSAALFDEVRHQVLAFIGPHWNVVGPEPWALTQAPVDNWFGAGALLLALLGLWSKALPRSTRALLVISSVAIEAKVFGFPPWYNDVIGHAPILEQIALWAYTGVIVSLSVALLAGAGMQRLELSWIRARDVLIATMVLVVGLGVVAAICLPGTVVRWDQVAVTGAVIAAVAGGALLVTRGTPWSRRSGSLLAGGAVVFELIFLATPELPLAVDYNPLSPTPSATYLQQVDPSGTGRTYSATGILYPDASDAYDLDDIRDIDALYVQRSWEYLKLFVAPTMVDRLNGTPPDEAVYTDNQFFNALNVEYILVSPPLAQNAAGLPSDQFRLQRVAADGVGIYRNLDAAPRAQVVFSATKVGSETAAITAMERHGYDPMTEAVVEASSSVSVPSSQHAPVAATIESYTDNEVVIRTTTSQAGTLVVADAFYPGWVAQVDGKSTPILATDLALRGVVVPGGRHTVVMRYEPTSIMIGAIGVPAGIAIWAIGGWGVPWLLRRRRRRGAARNNTHEGTGGSVVGPLELSSGAGGASSQTRDGPEP